MNEPKRYKLLISYDGTDFHGWQRQADVRTVQAELESAISRIFQTPISITGSGRTDAGVHALGQVAHFTVPACRLTETQLFKAINGLLPRDIRILSLEETDHTFHARFNAISRRYQYRLEYQPHPLRRRFCWVPPFQWDDAVIQRTVPMLIGRHSFQSFCLARPGEKEYLCTIYEAHWDVDASGVAFSICADRFFQRMVRGIVFTLIDIGRAFLLPADFERLLKQPKRNGDVRVAPPQGLTLMEVVY